MAVAGAIGTVAAVRGIAIAPTLAMVGADMNVTNSGDSCCAAPVTRADTNQSCNAS
jgi:hypothetical protein